MASPQGIFGASARAVLPPMDDPNNPNPEQSFLGGLVKYQKPSGQTPQDRMMLFSAMLKDAGNSLRGSGETDNVTQARMLAYQLALRAAAQQHQQKLAELAAQRQADANGVGAPSGQPSGEPQPQPPQAPPVDPMAAAAAQVSQTLAPQSGLAGNAVDQNALPAPITAPPEPVPPPVQAQGIAGPASGITANAPRRPLTMRDAAPELLGLAGIPGFEDQAKADTAIISAAEPKVTFDRGYGSDQYGNAAGGFHTELKPGQIPLYDAQGRFSGIKNADGALEAASAMTKAEEDAKNASAASYAAPKAYGEASGKAAVENPTTLETHPLNGVDTTLTRAQWAQIANGGQASAPAAAQGAPGGQPAQVAPGQGLMANGRLDPLAFYKSFIMPHEGGLNPSDLNGSPTFMGFNQASNRDIDVTKLTPESAAARFASNYYGPSGAANLSPALAAVHSDTSFINPSVAKNLLAQAGGDPQKYMALRQAWQQRLVQTSPRAAKYRDAWARRNQDLAALAAQLGGPASAQAAPQGATPVGIPAAAATMHGMNADDQKAVQGYLEDAKNAENLAGLGHKFLKLNGTTATGGLYDDHDVTIPLLHTEVPLNPLAPVMRGSHNDVRAMQNLSMQMALAMRTPGQRMTQMEIQQNLGRVPGITNPGPQNISTVRQYDGLAAQKRVYANFAQNWLATHGSLNGMDDAFKVQQAAQTKRGGSGGSVANAPRKADPLGIR